MSPARKFVIAIAGIAALILAGTIGYIEIAGMSPIDALYMAVITISTVGFGEVEPLGPGGRMFTIGLILSGVGTAFYLLAAVAELLVEGRLREFLGRTAMTRRIHQLEGHVIICGFGRFGRVVAEELGRNSIPVVVIDLDPAKEAELMRLELLHVIGSAVEDDVLERAGVRTARAIVAGTGSDADNVYITLSAREKNTAIRIHARAESEAGLRRLRLAGADQTISAYQWGGMRIAASLLRPSVVDFLELSVPGRGSEVDLEEIKVLENSAIVGKSIEAIERESSRLRIVALKRGAEPISIIPDRATPIAAGDFLVVIGERDGLKRLTEIAAVS